MHKVILKSEAEDVEVKDLLKTLKQDGSWPEINYEDLSRTGFENRVHLGNMVEMSLSFNTKESRYYRSKEISKGINSALFFWCEHDFLCENWWYNQVFTPTSLVTVLLLMDTHIDPDLKASALLIIERGNLSAPGARPGGDRIKFGGRGLQHDNSFHHRYDRVNTTFQTRRRVEDGPISVNNPAVRKNS